MHLHIDGDIIVYRCGFAAEKMQYYIEGLDNTVLQYKKEAKELCDINELPHDKIYGERVVEPVENALHNVSTTIDSICLAMDVTPEDITVYLSGDTNYRDEIGTIKPYKGNRDPDAKPTHLHAIRKYLNTHYNTKISEFEEADDMMAYTHYAMWTNDMDTCIVTTDKDLNMIPGLHYNFVKEEQHVVDAWDADRFFYEQLITGDSTDNIQGVKGKGIVAARNLYGDVMDAAELYKLALTLYVEGYGEEAAYDALIENARLLWIRRFPDEMWEPPTLPQQGGKEW